MNNKSDSTYSKQVISSSVAHDGEVYGTICDSAPGSSRCAFLRVADKRESLIFLASPDSKEVVVAKDTYVLSPCFAGKSLFRVERSSGNWEIRASRIDENSVVSDYVPFACVGRPVSLSSCSGQNADVLVWEERTGKRTRICYAVIGDDGFGERIEITDGLYNAYDPDCCIGSDGVLYVVACVFRDGQYRIEVYTVTVGAAPTDRSIQVSNQATACVHPSIYGGSDGEIWFCYTSYCEGIGEQAYVQDLHHRARKRFFEADSKLFVGMLKHGKLYSCLAPQNPQSFQGLSAAMIVHGSTGADYGRIFLDSYGRIRLLARKHAPGTSIAAAEAGDENRLLSHSPGTSHLEHPGISLYTLDDDRWTDPICLVTNAHIAAPLSLNIEHQTLFFAYSEDTRQTGWGPGAEWFDTKGRLTVGIGRFELDLANESIATRSPNYDIYPFRINPRSAPAIEEPIGQNTYNGFIHAMGQTHMHTNISVCIRDKDRDSHLNYRFTQDVQHSDFGGTTDHAYNMWHTEMLLTRKMAEYYYFPGEFVAIPAYEWTGTPDRFCNHEGGPWGHVNPLYLEETGDLDFYTPADPTCDGGSLQRLFETYRDKHILAPPHHVADHMHPYNWEFYYPSMEPIIEIFQDQRGSGEQHDATGVSNWFHREAGHWALDQLKSGRKFGFIGGADHAGIARAGVLVDELTRTALYEALMKRRCFASTGAAMIIDFACNDSTMGCVVNAEKGEFSIYVRANTQLQELQIVRDGTTVERIEIDDSETRHTWSAKRERNGEFWYVRILANNGEITWTSPIWLESS